MVFESLYLIAVIGVEEPLDIDPNMDQKICFWHEFRQMKNRIAWCSLNFALFHVVSCVGLEYVLRL